MRTGNFENLGWTLTVMGLTGMMVTRIVAPMLDEPTGALLMFLGVMLLGLGMLIMDRIDHVIEALNRLKKHS